MGRKPSVKTVETDPDAGLKKVFPGEVYQLESGEEIWVKPVPFGKLRIFSHAISSLLSKLQSAGIEDFSQSSSWAPLFDIAFEEVVALMALVLNKDREFFDTITLADGLGLFHKIVEQNWSESAKKNGQALLAKVKPIFQT